MKKQFVVSLLVFGTSAAAAVVAATPAAAEGIYCPDNRICMWEDPYAEGSRYVDRTVGGVGSFYDIGWFNGDNEISSAENNTGQSIRIWSNDNPTGRSFCMSPNSAHYDFRLFGFDNDAESFIVVDHC